MSKSGCIRCGEPLADPKRPCGFCIGERTRETVTVLVSAAGNTSNAALFQRVCAIQTLRSLGYTDWQAVEARAKALDGYSVEEIVDGLGCERAPDLAAAS